MRPGRLLSSPTIAMMLASTLSTACFMSSPFKRPPPSTMALMGSGFAAMVAGAFVYQSGTRKCWDAEMYDGCSLDDVHQVLAINFIAGGLVAASIGGMVMAFKGQ